VVPVRGWRGTRRRGVQVPLLQLGIPDRFIEHGTRHMSRSAGLDLADCPPVLSDGGPRKLKCGYGRQRRLRRRATPTRNGHAHPVTVRDFALSPLPFALSSFANDSA